MAKRTKPVKKIKKIIITIIIIILILIIGFLGYLIKRYLIPTVDTTVENTSETVSEEYEVTENSYKSDELEITIEKNEIGEDLDKITYYVADIKIQNPSRLGRAFANDEIGSNIVEKMSTICERNNAILAINGDYYSFRDNGIVIGNSQIYRNVPAREALAIYQDGTFEIFDETTVDATELVNNGVKDTLSFGPVLVRNGVIEANYDEYEVDKDNLIRTNIATENPRTGIGYYDKNHYCMIVVDGRQEGYSKGVTLNEFAKIFQELGCDIAYNLDGGNSASMFFMGKRVNQPSQPGDGEREISDIVYIK